MRKREKEIQGENRSVNEKEREGDTRVALLNGPGYHVSCIMISVWSIDNENPVNQ